MLRSDLPPVPGQAERHKAFSIASMASTVSGSGGEPFPGAYLATLAAIRPTSSGCRGGLQRLELISRRAVSIA